MHYSNATCRFVGSICKVDIPGCEPRAVRAPLDCEKLALMHVTVNMSPKLRGITRGKKRCNTIQTGESRTQLKFCKSITIMSFTDRVKGWRDNQTMING